MTTKSLSRLTGICVLLCCLDAAAQPTRQSLIEAERAFSAAAAEKGTKASFLEFLAPDAILFRPGPVNGPEWIKAGPDDPGLLSWGPSFAYLAASGDLGLTYGPWEYRGDRTQKDPAATGSFVSFWRHTPESGWKVVVDDGISHPAALADTLVQVFSSPPVALTGSGADSALYQLEAELSQQSSTSGFLTAMAPILRSDARFLQQGMAPVVGKPSPESTGSWNERITWETLGAIVSRSGDLACTYGTYQAPSETDGEPVKGHYVRAWTRAPGENWLLGLDLHYPDEANSRE